MYSEGWCLQYNKHLERSMLQVIQAPKDKTAAAATAASPQRPPPPPPQLGNNIKTTAPTQARSRSRQTSVGLYVVVKCGASGHNIRSSPSMSAAPIGILNFGDTFNVIGVAEGDGGEFWVQLDQDAVNKRCLVNDGAAWSLAVSSTNLQYLQSHTDMLKQEQEAVQQLTEEQDLLPEPVLGGKFSAAPPPPPLGFKGASAAKPTPPPRLKHDSVAAVAAAAASDLNSVMMRHRTPSPGSSESAGGGGARKPSFFQKWFKTADGGSPGGEYHAATLIRSVAKLFFSWQISVFEIFTSPIFFTFFVRIL